MRFDENWDEKVTMDRVSKKKIPREST